MQVSWLEHAARAAAGARWPSDHYYQPFNVAAEKAEWVKRVLEMRDEYGGSSGDEDDDDSEYGDSDGDDSDDDGDGDGCGGRGGEGSDGRKAARLWDYLKGGGSIRMPQGGGRGGRMYDLYNL